jgi:hypothetical protein
MAIFLYSLVVKSCGKEKTSFMFFVKLGEELQWKENLLCVLVFVELVEEL